MQQKPFIDSTVLYTYTITKLKNGSSAYKEAAAPFGEAGLVVADVWEVHNPTEHNDLANFRIKVSHKGGEPAPRRLYHAAGTDAVEKILRWGFNPAATRRAKYGYGVYFADDVRKSHQYAAQHGAVQSPSLFAGHHTMFVCDVDLGMNLTTSEPQAPSALFATHEQRMLRGIPGAMHNAYDSIVASPPGAPREYVLYGDAATSANVKYVVTYDLPAPKTGPGRLMQAAIASSTPTGP